MDVILRRLAVHVADIGLPRCEDPSLFICVTTFKVARHNTATLRTDGLSRTDVRTDNLRRQYRALDYTVLHRAIIKRCC